MQFSPSGFSLLKQSEGFKSHTYRDVAGFPTIGYGHRLLASESFSKGISETQAAQILSRDVRGAEEAVTRLVKVSLTQGQFDALVDFVFNLGQGKLASSTLLKDLNAGHYDAAAEQILRWDHGMEAGHEVELADLKSRRTAEFKLWHTGVTS